MKRLSEMGLIAPCSSFWRCKICDELRKKGKPRFSNRLQTVTRPRTIIHFANLGPQVLLKILPKSRRPSTTSCPCQRTMTPP